MQDYVTHCQKQILGQFYDVGSTIDDMCVETPVKHPHLKASDTKGSLTTSNEAPAPSQPLSCLCKNDGQTSQSDTVTIVTGQEVTTGKNDSIDTKYDLTISLKPNIASYT